MPPLGIIQYGIIFASGNAGCCCSLSVVQKNGQQHENLQQLSLPHKASPNHGSDCSALIDSSAVSSQPIRMLLGSKLNLSSVVWHLACMAWLPTMQSLQKNEID